MCAYVQSNCVAAAGQHIPFHPDHDVAGSPREEVHLQEASRQVQDVPLSLPD